MCWPSVMLQVPFRASDLGFDKPVPPLHRHLPHRRCRSILDMEAANLNRRFFAPLETDHCCGDLSVPPLAILVWWLKWCGVKSLALYSGHSPSALAPRDREPGMRCGVDLMRTRRWRVLRYEPCSLWRGTTPGHWKLHNDTLLPLVRMTNSCTANGNWLVVAGCKTTSSW